MAFAVALVLLAAASYCDVKRLEVPNIITVPPFLGAAALWAWRGEWALVGLFALLLVAADLLPPAAALGTGVMGAVLAGWFVRSPQAATVAVAWGAFFALYALNVIAEADTKILMALFGFFPDPALLLCILAGWLMVGGLFLFRRYGKRAVPTVLRHSFAFFAGGPSREELEERGAPLVPAIAVGFLLYVMLEVML